MNARTSTPVYRWQLVLATAGCLVFLSIALGCMSLNIGTGTELVQGDDGSGFQCGSVIIPPNHEMDVYYPVPYQGTPNLDMRNHWDDCRVLDQKPDHFRVKNPSAFSREINWKARGIKIGSPNAVPANNIYTPPEAVSTTPLSLSETPAPKN